MATGSNLRRTLIEKLAELAPERVTEVEDFIDFLRARDRDVTLLRAATRVSEASFAKVWDNTDDAAYDKL